MCWDERARVTVATRKRTLSRGELLELERQITEGVGDGILVEVKLNGVPVKDYYPVR